MRQFYGFIVVFCVCACGETAVTETDVQPVDTGATSETDASVGADADSADDGVPGTDALDTQDSADIPVECTADTDCAGLAAACATPTCVSGACKLVAAAKGSSCDDGNACTLGETCSLGACLPASVTTCDDGVSCTVDSCDAKTGCAHAANGALCSDGNPCTNDGCSADKGCTFSPNQATCSDNNACTTGDECSGGLCLPGASTTCDDNDLCSEDTCNPMTGCKHATIASQCTDGNACTDDACSPSLGCTYLPNQLACSDNNACTVNDVCSGGVCLPGASTTCDDNNVCTTDACDAATGCQHLAKFSPCNDGNPCTSDACDAILGCVFLPAPVTCEDGNVCTTGDQCGGGVCIPGAATSCDDGNTCTLDSCDALAGCQHAPTASPCDDSDVCTLGDACKDTFCVPGQVTLCNDGNVCTSDGCNASSGCTFTANSAPCSDGNACTSPDACSASTCKGAQVTCDDGNPCTTDYCDAVAGCKTVDNALPCDDKTVCTTNDTCALGLCAGVTVNCEDGNPCTADACDAITGCSHPAGNDGASCGDAGGGTCVAGSCSLGSNGNPAASCKQIKANLPDSPSGLYWLDPDGPGGTAKFHAYCEQVADGGGWTLVLKADGSQLTFAYDKPIWLSTSGYAVDQVDFDGTEAKLQGFWTVPVSDIRVGIKVAGVTQYLVVPYTASSLQAALADNVYHAFDPPLGRAKWKGLIAGSSLQLNCNREGLNNDVDGYARVRIGILGNDGSDCLMTDSYLGIGGASTSCGSTSVGDAACYGGDNGDKAVAGFGYVFVR